MRSALLVCTVGLVLSCDTVTAQTQTASAQVVGSVIDADSKAPIAGVRITVFPATRPTMPMPITPLAAVTDESGRFVLEGVQPGPVRVSAQKQGFAFDPREAQTLDVRAGQTSSIVLALRRGGVLTGRVLDDRDEPVSDIRVMAVQTLNGRDQPSMGSGGPGMVTNDLGEFRLSGLPAGDYVLMATRQPMGTSNNGGTAWASTFYPSTTTRAEAQTVTLQLGDTVTGLEVRLISAPSFRVAGIVIDASGKPVPDAMVTLQSRDANGRGAFFAPPLFTRANADGTFVIGGVLSGTYEVSATRMIRSDTVVSSTFLAMGSSRWGSETLQQIVVDSADVTGLKVVAPPPPR